MRAPQVPKIFFSAPEWVNAKGPRNRGHTSNKLWYFSAPFWVPFSYSTVLLRVQYGTSYCTVKNVSRCYDIPELDKMVNPVPFSAAGNGLLGFGLLGNGGSDGCGDFV